MDPRDALGLEPAFDALGLDPATATTAAAERACRAAVYRCRSAGDDEGAAIACAALAVVVRHRGAAPPAPTWSPRTIADRLRDGDVDRVAAALDALLAAHATRALAEVAAAVAHDGGPGPSAASAALVALARGLAFADVARARRLLALVDGRPDARLDRALALDEARALVAAVDDLPAGEAAARRALAQVAASRVWRPDASGRDHGALVAVVRRRLKAGPSTPDGPLVAWLRTGSPLAIRALSLRATGESGRPVGLAPLETPPDRAWYEGVLDRPTDLEPERPIVPTDAPEVVLGPHASRAQRAALLGEDREPRHDRPARRDRAAERTARTVVIVIAAAALALAAAYLSRAR